MKKIILLALITLMTCTRGAGQSMFSGSTELEIIANEWENITLNGVANGSLVSMLDCFNQKWPTWMLNAAIQTMKKGVDGRDSYENEQIVVRNKPKNGFVSVDWWGNAEHKYPSIHFVCFYDYDPKKHTLTPEPQIIDGFRTTEDIKYYYDLPEEGKEFRISEFGERGHYIHTFKWDGMKPVLSQSEKIEEDYEEEHCDEEEE